MMMPLVTFREKLNTCIRDNNVRLESSEKQHQEHLRVIAKLVKDVQSCIKNANAKQSGTGKRVFSSISTEDIDENKPVVFRSSRNAARVASAKIRSISGEGDSQGSVKRRCIVKAERISIPTSTLDIICEELEELDSPEVCQSSQLPVRKESVKNKHSNHLTSATAHVQPNPGLEPVCNGDPIEKTESPSTILEKSLSSEVPANSTFVVDTVKSEALKCELPDVSNLANKKVEDKSPVQNPDVTGLHKVKEAESSDSVSIKVMEGMPLKNFMPEEINNPARGWCSEKSQKENAPDQNKETYINLQKLITESPVRVTRTKTRALAKAAAAAASAETSESAQKNTTNSIQADSMDSAKLAKKKTKADNKKEVNGKSESLISPVFKKPPYKISPEDHMKENYISSTEKSWKSATKDLSNSNRLKTPLSSNNSLLCSNLQSSNLKATGTGTIISYCDTFIPKNSAKPVLAQQNQKLQEEKVIEAEKKREKLLKEKTEQKKRINEARAAKVAKAREKLEMQRALQQQQVEREKEQRLKIAQQKREEEIAIKRQIAHQRTVEAEERRKQEEEQILIALKKKEKEKEEAEKAAEKKALQLKKEVEVQLKAKEAEKIKNETKVKAVASGNNIIPQPSDIFNTDDIYSGGNSDEEENKEKKIYPAWTSGNRVQLQLQYQEKCALLLHKFFQSERHTPDLRKIFGNVPAKALVRTSSAVWNTPPCNRSFK